MMINHNINYLVKKEYNSKENKKWKFLKKERNKLLLNQEQHNIQPNLWASLIEKHIPKKENLKSKEENNTRISRHLINKLKGTCK